MDDLGPRRVRDLIRLDICCERLLSPVAFNEKVLEGTPTLRYSDYRP